MQITDCKPTKKGRIGLFCGEAFLFSVPPELFVTSEVQKGAKVSAEQLEALRLAAERFDCRERALDLLSYRDHSRGELTDKLKRTHPDCAEEVASALAEEGLIDDRRFAAQLIEDLRAGRSLGRARVAQMLRQKRIAPELIRELLGDREEEDEVAGARRLIEGKFARRLLQPDGLRKVAAALARQGYSYGVIRRAMAAQGEEFQAESEVLDD